ncbi:hypothetical protein [Bacillus cereus]|uniref:hypothetical protein n=1 Tax=Bacillus cereus TaxID=1396 RepID=UPI0001A0AA32|nr:hypothetical protein bcere0022_18830 [Bacillus cereus Rock3-44]
MYVFPTRIAVVAPVIAPSVHTAPVHTVTSDVGIELPATWQQYPLPGATTPSFWHQGSHSASPSYHGSLPVSPYPSLQIFYHFPAIYFQNFHGTFNI